jgi:hypothetical protein
MSPREILSVSTLISIKFFVTSLQACLVGNLDTEVNSRRFSLPGNSLTAHQLASEPKVSIFGHPEIT